MERQDGKNPFDHQTYYDSHGLTISTMVELRACFAEFFNKHVRVDTPTNGVMMADFISLVTHSGTFFARARAVIPELQIPQDECFHLNGNVQDVLVATQHLRGPPGKKWSILPEELVWSKLAKNGLEKAKKDATAQKTHPQDMTTGLIKERTNDLWLSLNDIDAFKAEPVEKLSTAQSLLNPDSAAASNAEPVGKSTNDSLSNLDNALTSSAKSLEKKLPTTLRADVPEFVPQSVIKLVGPSIEEMRERRTGKLYQSPTITSDVENSPTHSPINTPSTASEHKTQPFMLMSATDSMTAPGEPNPCSIKPPPDPYSILEGVAYPHQQGPSSVPELSEPHMSRSPSITPQHANYEQHAHGPRMSTTRFNPLYPSNSPFQCNLPDRFHPDGITHSLNTSRDTSHQVINNYHHQPHVLDALQQLHISSVASHENENPLNAPFHSQLQSAEPGLVDNGALVVPPQGAMSPLDYWNMLYRRDSELRAQINRCRTQISDLLSNYLIMLGECRLRAVASQLPLRGRQNSRQWLRTLQDTMAGIWVQRPGQMENTEIVIARKRDFEKVVAMEIDWAAREA